MTGLKFHNKDLASSFCFILILIHLALEVKFFDMTEAIGL